MNCRLLACFAIPFECLIGKVDMNMKVIKKNIPKNRNLLTLTNTISINKTSSYMSVLH